jgi:uncharacterized protein
MILSQYCVIYPDTSDHDSVILFSTKRASSVLIERSVLAAIENGTLCDDEKQTLIDLGFLVNSIEEERHEMLHFFDGLNEIDTRLSIVLAMNLDCNLACPYCFEGSRRGKHYMSADTANNVIEFIDKNLVAGRDELHVGFYGGEPLLSIDPVQDMAGRLKNMTERRGIQFSFSLTTNGTLLTLGVVNRLKALGLKAVAVTLDGPEDVHNVSRPFATGAGSFSAIVKNIRAVSGEIDIDIGGNFSEENYREFPRLLDYLLQLDITPDKVKSVKFDPVLKERDGIASSDFNSGCRSINEPWLFEAGVFLRKEIINRGFPTGGVVPTICAIERRGMFIINYDGAIYKCPGMIGQPEFRVGDVVNGVGDYSVSHDMENWKKEECMGCVYLPLCFGGCRYMKLLSDGNMAGIDCRKPYYDACLEGLVRQDLAFA